MTDLEKLADAYIKAHGAGYDEGQRDAEIAEFLERLDKEKT